MKCWQSEGFIFYCMGVAMLLLALYVLTGEAVVRRGEFTAVEERLAVLDQRVMRLETPPVVKKRWR